MSFQQRAKAQAAQETFSNATVAVLFLALTFPYVSSLLLIETPFILPKLSAFALASAALVAIAAWGAASRQECSDITLWDVSGIYACVGFAAGMLSEPGQVMELWALPTSEPGAAR
jgi:cytochrome bd-type quinol oxidase subunit 2